MKQKHFLLLGMVVLLTFVLLGCGLQGVAYGLSPANQVVEFRSLEEFVESINSERLNSIAGKGTNFEPHINISAIETLYFPINIPEEYPLYRILVYSEAVVITFVHQDYLSSEETAREAIGLRRTFEFGFTRRNLNTDFPMEGTLRQNNVAKAEYYTFAEPNLLFWVSDSERLSLYMPMAMTDEKALAIVTGEICYMQLGEFLRNLLMVDESQMQQLTETITVNLQDSNEVVALLDLARQHSPGDRLALLASLSASTPNTNSEQPSSWAAEQVSAAIGANLVPTPLQTRYTQAITRAEFCALAVALYENVLEEIAGRKTFADTDDINVEKMAAIGVVTGIGNNRFAPDDTLTREQAATMLSRLGEAIGMQLYERPPVFYDNSDISDWAFREVGQMQFAEIMGGIGNNIFSPKGNFTREQSIITMLRLFNALELEAFGTSPNMQANTGNLPASGGTINALIIYRTLEETAERATDVVIARYVTHRPFGLGTTEFEFVVEEKILGSAADRIFVYMQNNPMTSVIGGKPTENEISLSTTTRYLLLLERIVSTRAATHEEGFWALGNLVIDLYNPTMSTMYNEPISQHSSGMDFNSSGLSRDMILSYIRDLTRYNTPSRAPLRSDSIEAIIDGSPYVAIVEVGEPWSLARDAGPPYGMVPTDIFHTTVVEVLKGDMEVGDVLRVGFPVDAVAQGEQHIIAIEPVSRAPTYFHMLTTRGDRSLFSLSQLEEILSILSCIDSTKAHENTE